MVLDVEIRIDLRRDQKGGVFDYFFQLDVDEVVERIYVLLDKAFAFEESWEKIPFVLSRIDWGIGVFLIVEGLERGVEAVVW